MIFLQRQLHSDRQRIIDVPAVYFCEPTAESIARICRDLKDGLYDAFYLNFTSSLSRSLLEDLAYHAVQTGMAERILRVYDQYLDFVCLEEGLFTLTGPLAAGLEVYGRLHGTGSSEALVEATVEAVAAGLFSAVQGLSPPQHPPLIVASRTGGSAEMVGERLETRIANQLANGRVKPDVRLQRPVIVVLDRNFDLCTVVAHSSAYNALVADILGMQDNRITLAERKNYDIDSEDAFWTANATLPFPTVAENVDTAVATYKTDRDQLTRGSSVTQGILDGSMTADQTPPGNLTAEELKLAISLVPELTARKRIIDMHLDLSTALLEHIKTRDLGEYFLIEQQLLTNQIAGEAARAAVMGLIKKPGDANDKLRLLLVYYYSNPVDLGSFEAVLGCSLDPLGWIKRQQSFAKLAADSKVPPVSPRGNQLLSKTVAGSEMLVKGVGGVLGNLVSSVRSFIPDALGSGGDQIPITRQLDSAIDQITNANPSPANTTTTSTTFRLLDPTKRGGPAGAPLSLAAIEELFVFVVGGITYTEYNAIQEHAKV